MCTSTSVIIIACLCHTNIISSVYIFSFLLIVILVLFASMEKSHTCQNLIIEKSILCKVVKRLLSQFDIKNNLIGTRQD